VARAARRDRPQSEPRPRVDDRRRPARRRRSRVDAARRAALARRRLRVRAASRRPSRRVPLVRRRVAGAFADGDRGLRLRRRGQVSRGAAESAEEASGEGHAVSRLPSVEAGKARRRMTRTNCVPLSASSAPPRDTRRFVGQRRWKIGSVSSWTCRIRQPIAVQYSGLRSGSTRVLKLPSVFTWWSRSSSRIRGQYLSMRSRSPER